jgi:hypothetical protein
VTSDGVGPRGEVRRAVSELRTRFSGQLLEQDDSGYDSARKVWSGSIDRYSALIEPRLPVEVDKDIGGVEVIGGQIATGLAQPPHVLAVEAVQLVGDIQPPVAALGPHPVWMLSVHDLDERGVAAPGMPIAMLQPECLA